jgi:hypothetical protein
MVFDIEFSSKAGDLADLVVHTSDPDPVVPGLTGTGGLTPAAFTVTELVAGTGVPVGGSFALSFRGQRTGYIAADASAVEVQAELEELSTVGSVSVQRSDEDESGGYTWTVTFLNNLGDLPSLVVDDVTLTGTLASVAVAEDTKGVLPAFNQGVGGLALGSAIVTDIDSTSYAIRNLAQGVQYYVRVSATNSVGYGPALICFPAAAAPQPQPADAPEGVLFFDDWW